MKTVIFYESNPVAPMEQFIEVYPQENEEKFVESGKALGIGPFSVPGVGVMGFFAECESAEDFVKNNPSVLQGLVAKVTMREWHDELL